MSNFDNTPRSMAEKVSKKKNHLFKTTLKQASSASSFYLFIALILMCGIFATLRSSQFLSEYNIRTIFIDSSVLMIIAMGQMLVIATSGIDLSVGSVLIFSGVTANLTMVAIGGDSFPVVFFGFIVSILSGLLWGIINGTLVAKLKIPALITTLGTTGMASGIALILTNGSNVGGVPASLVKHIGSGKFLGILPWLIIIAFIVVVVIYIIIKFTRLGLYTIAIGANEEAARRAGIKVSAHLIKIYAISGSLAGIAGFLNLARFSSTTISGHTSDNLQTVAAVVLGGTSLLGGIVSVIGTVIGVFIPIILQNGLILLNVKPFWQTVIIGAILIIAVYSDQLKRNNKLK